MRALPLLILASIPAWATGWTYVGESATAPQCTGSITTCTITYTATAGNRLVMGAYASATSTVHLTGVTNGTTAWTLCTSQACESNYTGTSQDNAFLPSAAYGSQTYTLTWSNTVTFTSSFILEFSCVGCGTATYDTGGADTNGGAICSSCPSATLTLGGSYDLIVYNIIGVGGTPTACGSYTLDPLTYSCYGLNQTVGTGQTLTQSPSSVYINSEIAIKATAPSGGIPGQFPRVN